MKKKKERNKGIRLVGGLILLAAIAATYCEATNCYDEGTATTCISSGTWVDDIYLCEGSSSSACGSTPVVHLYADSIWYNHPYVVASGGQYPAALWHACGGPVHYTNPLNGQSSATEHCDYWQYALWDWSGVFSGYSPATYGYHGVDYNSWPTCAN